MPQSALGGAASHSPAHAAGEWSGFRVRALDLLVIALAAFVLRVPSVSLSVFGSADESAFILAGREVVLGNLPYLSFWDHKPLGSTVLIAAAMALLGQSIEAVRALGMACVIGTGCLLYLMAQRFSPGRLVPLAAALLYVAFSTRLAGGIATITEVTFAPFTAAGVLLLMTAAPERRQGAPGLVSTFAAAGLAFGISVWIKYVPAVPAALTGGAALVALLLHERQRGLARAAACGAAFAAGLLLPTAASMAWYWWMGLFDVFWYANFGFMARYAGESGFQDHVRGALFYALRCVTLVVLDIWPLFAAAAAAFLPACLGHLFARGKAYAGALAVVWLAGEMLAVAVQMKFYMYHFLPLLPPLCLLSALAIRAHVDRLALPRKAALATVLAVAFAAFGPVAAHARAVAAALSRPDVPREVAKIVAQELRPGDRVFVA
ncbi:MAG: glycosyltransferase family 39 protein, partial [Acetobacteraceae bacterium]|nr:glycosyltransferase family 39 protein [Acetobacteraceae bacterium]